MVADAIAFKEDIRNQIRGSPNGPLRLAEDRVLSTLR